MITIVHQHGTADQPKYRVEIADAGGYGLGYGLGYGDTPRMAYADARRAYADYRECETRNTVAIIDRIDAGRPRASGS